MSFEIPYKTLTPILGKEAPYNPSEETTPKFMNGKFNELLENDKALENQINVLNTYIGRLGVEKVSAQNGGDTNLIKETGIRFVFNVEHLPSGYSYGMLETFKLESGGFSPSNEGVCVQRFTDWYSGYTFTRTYRQMSWGEWNCPDAKIEALQEQITAISNMLMETANLEQE